MSAPLNIVLVHGAWADGSCWSGVIERLQAAVHHFAADVDPVKARVMYAVQPPLAMTALQDVMGVPAWKSLPSWYLVATSEEAIPPDAERQFAGRMAPPPPRSRRAMWR
jgi:hypothetical protein